MSNNFNDDSNNDDSPMFNPNVFFEDNLMETMVPSPRIFMMDNDKNTTIVGFVLSENPDSFLVSLPSKLIDSEGVKSIHPFINLPFIRLSKNAIAITMNLFGEFEEHFIEYLRGPGKDRYPDIEEEIEVYLSEYDDADLPETLARPSAQGKISKGMDDKELAKKLADAEDSGSLISETNGTKH